MVKLNSWSTNLGYPIYGARFVNDNTLIVAGGGGDGNNGIPNKMTAVVVRPENTKKPLKRYRELVLNDKEDSVMSLDIGNDIILAGINESSMAMHKGINKHLRKFKFENDHLKFVESAQIHSNTSSNIYQKIVAVSKDGTVGVIVMSETPSIMYIIETIPELEEKFKIIPEGDVKDITISLDGKLMCYITSDVFKVISLVTGNSVFKTTINFNMSKVRFIDNNEVIISGSNGKDALIAKFSIANSKIIQQKVVMKNLKGITSMDVNTSNGLTAIATSNYSIVIIRTSDLKVLKIMNKVHDFAITKTVFSDNGQYLASTSAANTINVIQIPENFTQTKSLLATIFQYLISIILIALFAVLTQYLHDNGYLTMALNKVYDLYESYKPQDSSSYFTIEEIPSFEGSTTTTFIHPEMGSDDVLAFVSTSLPATSVIMSTASAENTATVASSSILKSRQEIKPITPITAGEVDVPSEKLAKHAVETGNVAGLSSAFTPTVKTELPTVSSFDVAGETIKNDIVSLGDITTPTAATNTNTELSTASTRVNTMENASLGETQATEVKSVSTEITKEIIKEITSIVVDTSVETLTSTSTLVDTSIETLTQTSVHVITETDIQLSTSTLVEVKTETSTVVNTEKSTIHETVTVPVTVSVTSTVVETHTPVSHVIESITVPEENVPSTTETHESDGLAIQIEPSSEVFDDYAKARESENEKVIEELTSQKETAGLDADFSIEIEPSIEVFDDPIEAAESQQKRVVEEMQTLKDAENHKVSIQIEPSKAVYVDVTDALSAQEDKVLEELLNTASEEHKVTAVETIMSDSPDSEEVTLQVEPSSAVFLENNDGSQAEEQKVLEELHDQMGNAGEFEAADHVNPMIKDEL